MGSPPESPFKADEPVSTSRKWIILAAIGLVLSLSGSGYAAVTKFDLEYDTVWRTLRVVIEAGLVVILVRAALAAGRCRKHRSFDMMATALRAQRPFWVLLTVFGAPGPLGMGAVEGQGGGHIRRIAVWGPDNSQYPGKPYMMFDADPGVELKVTVNVAFREVGTSHGKPVIETLREFSRLANFIISLFD